MVEEIDHGDHVCLAFADDAEQQRVAPTYLLTGLRRGERVMYFADQRTPTQVLDWLRAAGRDPEPALASGQLVVTTADDSYLAAGTFDADSMVATLRQEVADSLRAGYTGFRVSGEMAWALRDVPGSERLGEYETKANAAFEGHRASAVCQYDDRRIDAAALADFEAGHPQVVAAPSLHSSATLRLVPAFRSGERALRVVGAVDYHSAPALAAALATAQNWPGDLWVDMSNLDFIDLAGVRELVRAAERLHIVDLAPMLSQVFHVVGWDASA
ncbi:MEDS domain-containing protein [Streptomyces griseosporeus]|uniref:MEDS domain-containing protein n=1 Tax=Streptomyces griseosporeus TaxID=1910 RepID=UPI0036F899A2